MTVWAIYHICPALALLCLLLQSAEVVHFQGGTFLFLCAIPASAVISELVELLLITARRLPCCDLWNGVAKGEGRLNEKREGAL